MEADSVRPLVDLDGNITFIHETVMECALGRKIRATRSYTNWTAMGSIIRAEISQSASRASLA